MFTYTDRVAIFLIAVAIIFFDSIRDLLEIFHRGVFIDQRALLMKKTNKELRQMLEGHRSISNLKKVDLVELVML